MFRLICMCCIIYLINFSHITSGALMAPKLEAMHYYHPGDINLGVIGYLHAPDSNDVCGSTGSFMGNDVVQQPESIYYSMDIINKRDDLLPNITLGFVFMDGCLSPNAGSARAVYFINEPSDTCSSYKSSDLTSEYTFPPWFDTNATVTDFTHYKVAGIVGPPSSGEAMTVGALLSAFDIPVLATFASSDQLSDEGRFKYFSRLVPPDNFQTQAMVDVLEYFGWNYVSVLYAEGNYGENAGKQFTKWVKERDDTCIAFSYMIPNNADDLEIQYIVDNLEKHKNARVVILFAAGMQNIFEEIDARNLTGHFIWFGSDTVAGMEHGPLARYAEGTLYMTFEGVSTAPRFEEYFKQLNPWNATSQNPYLVDAWKDIYKCNWAENINKTESKSCYSYNTFGDDPAFRIGLTIGKLIDGVDVYAYALHDLISKDCPDAFQNKSQLDSCITGDKLLKYMRNVTFQGVTGTIKFDQKGDILGAYSIVQIQLDDVKGYHGNQIGIWDKITESVKINRSLIEWRIQNNHNSRDYHYYETSYNETDISLPISICSWECEDKFYHIQQELPCCWLCSKCRDNERIVDNSTACGICPENSWPDEETAMQCIQISDSYLQPKDGICIGLFIVSAIGIIFWAIVVIVFIKRREEKLIKACNRELSFLILIGALLAFVTVFVYVARPTHISCVFREIGFHMSVNILFGPLLVKTNRVYRIFESGKKSIGMPPFVTAAAQRVFTTIVCLVEVRL